MIPPEKTDPAQRLVIFESVGLVSAVFVFYHLFCGHFVYFFRLHPLFEKQGLFLKYIHSGRMKKIIPGEIDLNKQTALNNEVLDNLDTYYSRRFAGLGFIKALQIQMNTPHVDTTFKKELSMYILEKLQVFQRLDTLAESSNPPLLYYPDDLFCSETYAFESIKRLRENTRIIIPFSGKVLAYCNQEREKLFWFFVFLAFPLWILIQSGFRRGSFPQKQTFSLGIRIYANDYSFIPKYRSIDFLLDSITLTRENTLFCVETDISREYEKKLMEKGYNFIHIRKILDHSDMGPVCHTLVRSLIPLWCRSFLSLAFQRALIIRLFIEIQYKTIIWSSFSRKYSLKHYVTYNDTIPGDTIRNLILSRNDAQTWYFIHSIDNFDHYTPQTDKILYREVLYSYLYYDHLVVWSENSEQFYRICPNFIGSYERLGCLWSEHICYVRRHPETNDVLTCARDHFLKTTGTMPKKIIGVFDTTAGGAQMPLQSGDMQAFIDGIIILLDAFPDTSVIFKNKNPISYTSVHWPEMLEIYQKLIDHPRCYITNANQSDPSEVTAIADLVISACFTSITVEALGAHKRAMYFDATGKFRDLYFDRFPNFVAHDTKELIQLTDFWLYKNSDDAFAKFLSAYIKGELESHLDGKAITRFREKLCS